MMEYQLMHPTGVEYLMLEGLPPKEIHARFLNVCQNSLYFLVTIYNWLNNSIGVENSVKMDHLRPELSKL